MKKSLLALTLLFSSASFASGNFTKVTVSDYPFAIKFEGPQAVSVMLGTEEGNYCDFTFLRSNVKQGYKIELNSQSDSESFSSSCSWNGENYVLSSKHPTFAKFEISSIDQTKKEAHMKLDLKVINSSNLENFVNLNLNDIPITGQQFINLTTTPKE